MNKADNAFIGMSAQPVAFSIQTSPAKRQSQVESEMGFIECAAEELHAVISQLEQRLGAVLMTAVIPAPAESEPTEDNRVDLARRINTVRNRTNYATRRVSEILERLEL
jgi:hypothetical protein